MPWTFYNSNGQKLSTATTLIDNLDIDGATDIGEPIANGDLLIIDNGAGGTNRKTTVDRLKTYVASAVSREGGQTSEATTTSTSEDDLLTSSSLTIAATQPFFAVAVVRKTSGAASRAELHLALNSTNANGTNVFSTTNQAEAQLVKWEYGARVANYLGHGYQFATDAAPNAVGKYAINSVALPTAEVTTVKLRGRSLHADVTYGVDEIHVYSLVTS